VSCVSFSHFHIPCQLPKRQSNTNITPTPSLPQYLIRQDQIQKFAQRLFHIIAINLTCHSSEEEALVDEQKRDKEVPCVGVDKA
jgi:hypothetical protein